MASVIVVGSANQDYVMTIDALPAVGETALAKTMQKFPGGKGANQAVACARLGIQVGFVGAVGDDDDGALIIRELRSEGIDTSEIEITTSERTGMAVVSMLPGGENSIMVVPGANFTLAPERVVRSVQRLAGDDSVVLVQAEIPVDTITAAMHAAAKAGARAVMNLAPFVELPDETIQGADPLVVNAVEAAQLTGYVIDNSMQARQAAKDLARRAKSAVITLGAAGASWASADSSGIVPGLPVAEVVDTTGAGDAFTGAIAAMFIEGRDLESAVRVGVEVGALAVAQVGAQASYPFRDEVRQLATTGSTTVK